MNIFEERNFNVDDRNKLKNVIESVIVAMEEIKDLTDSMNEVIPIDKTTINVKKQAERELRYRDKRSGSNDFKNSAF